MAETVLKPPYVSTGQQHDAAMLGMYIFLASEIMLFGGLFAVIFFCRFVHGPETVAVSKQFHLWLGTINTALLLTSSLAVALAVALGRGGSKKAAAWLAAAAGLGLVFLLVKGWEYTEEYREGLLPVLTNQATLPPPGRLFVDIYFVATVLHALHLLLGLGLLSVMTYRIRRGSLQLPQRVVVLEVSGLYWHFVDVVWIFLYPALYLVR